MRDKWWQDPRIYSHHSIFKTISRMYPLSLPVKPKKFYETFESSSKKGVICMDLFAIGILNRKTVIEAPDKKQISLFCSPNSCKQILQFNTKNETNKKSPTSTCARCINMQILSVNGDQCPSSVTPKKQNCSFYILSLVKYKTDVTFLRKGLPPPKQPPSPNPTVF